MNNAQKPYQILLHLGSIINKQLPEKHNYQESKKNHTLDFNSEKYKKLITKFNNLKQFQNLQLTNEDTLIIAFAWYKYIVDREFQIDPLKLLEAIFPNPYERIKQLDRIIKLLKHNILYTKKKEVKFQRKRKSDSASHINFQKYYLLENDVSIHYSFSRLILGEEIEVNNDIDKPYQSNKEFLSDWFTYIDKLYRFSLWDFSIRKTNSALDEIPANEMLEAIQWKGRIEQRLNKTNITFPLMDIVDEYKLDENESIILMFLVKEDMEGNDGADVEDVLKLISCDQQEMYRNREYVSIDSRLVKNGLIEIYENVFFRTKSSDIRISSDITRRIIMKTPVNDDEKLLQILKGNNFYTLFEPAQTLNDLILPAEMKNTIRTSLKQYISNVDDVISKWGLYEAGMHEVGKTDKKIEPGMLMLFYGPPGTGKTFAAGAIANYLGKKLLVTDMSRIQSKWVGDSEKNIQRMFSLFERIVRSTDNPPVLLLNEADQFLNKRLNNTSTSVDIMFNTLQNLFLTAFERLQGILIATTNLRENIDTAFSRRFHLKLEFPLPDFEERIKLWKLHISDMIPTSKDIDIPALANSYQLTGGQIKIIVKNACIEAASRKSEGRKLKQKDLIKYCDIEVESSFCMKKNPIGFIRKIKNT